MTKFLKSSKFYESTTLDGSLYFQDSSVYIKRNNNDLEFYDPSLGLATLSSILGAANAKSYLGASGFVDSTNGDDNNGEVGNILRPFETIQGAYDAIPGDTRNIFLSSSITEDVSISGGNTNFYLLNEMEWIGNIIANDISSGSIIGNSDAKYQGFIDTSAGSDSVWYLRDLNEVFSLDDKELFSGGNLEIANIRWIEGNGIHVFNNLNSSIKITTVGQIHNSNDSSTSYIFKSGDIYLRNIGLMVIDSSSGRINENSDEDPALMKEAFNTTFKSKGTIWSSSYSNQRFRNCRFISSDTALLSKSYLTNNCGYELYDCQVDTSSNDFITNDNDGNALTVMGLLRNCSNLQESNGNDPSILNVLNDVYLSTFKINFPWYTYPFD